MTLHDINISTPHQWWLRAKRAGYAFAHLSSRYGSLSDPDWPRLVRSALFWTVACVGSVTATLVGILGIVPLLVLGVAGLALCALQIIRVALSNRADFPSLRSALEWSGLLFYSKLAQSEGWWRHKLDHWRAAQGKLIEYK
jgi:hypothetical protein